MNKYHHARANNQSVDITDTLIPQGEGDDIVNLYNHASTSTITPVKVNSNPLHQQGGGDGMDLTDALSLIV